MKCFVIADVHSFYDELLSALSTAGFDRDNEDHVLVSLGDLLDRGSKPIECLEFINSLPRKILIRGNHEDLLEELFYIGAFGPHDIHNGTMDTCIQLSGRQPYNGEFFREREIIEDAKNNEQLQTYLSSLIDYAETSKYIFVHGWIPSGDDWREGDWKRARWYNGMSSYPYTSKSKTQDKTILCGHWHTSYGHSMINKDGPEFDIKHKDGTVEKANFTTFEDDGIIALDACTVVSGFINCKVLDIPKNELERYL